MIYPPDQVTLRWCPKCEEFVKKKYHECAHKHKPVKTIAAIYTLVLVEKEPGSSKL